MTPADHTLILIHYQSQMAFATRSIDAVELRNNTALVAQGAAGFGVSTNLKELFRPDVRRGHGRLPKAGTDQPHDHDCWEDVNVIRTVNAIGKERVVFGGPWTSVCIVRPVLSALEQGYQVHVLTTRAVTSPPRRTGVPCNAWCRQAPAR